jgi:hypothetical protein
MKIAALCAKSPHGVREALTMRLMPRYLVERLFDHISEDDMLEAAVRSDSVRKSDFPDLTWEHSYVCVEDDGKILSFCIYEAPDEASIRRHGAAFGSHVVGRVWEIVDDMSPAILAEKLASRSPAARR